MPYLSVPPILIDGLGPEREGGKKTGKKLAEDGFKSKPLGVSVFLGMNMAPWSEDPQITPPLF
jgi:hypothetical protein